MALRVLNGKAASALILGILVEPVNRSPRPTPLVGCRAGRNVESALFAGPISVRTSPCEHPTRVPTTSRTTVPRRKAPLLVVNQAGVSQRVMPR